MSFRQRIGRVLSQSSSGAALLLVAWISSVSFATTYYVAPGGDDDSSNPGTSSSSPLKTLDEAVSRCTSSTDTINLKGNSTYIPTQSVGFRVFNKENITIRSQPGTGTATLDGLDVWPTRGNPNGSPNFALLDIRDCKDITVSGLKIKRSANAGVGVYETPSGFGSNNVTIEDCEIREIYTHGVVIKTIGTSNRVTNTTVRDCHVTLVCESAHVNNEGSIDPITNQLVNAPTGEAIRIFNSDITTIEDNLVEQYYKEGVDAAWNAKRTYILRNHVGPRNANTFYTTTRGTAIYVEAGPSSGTTELTTIDGNWCEGDAYGITIASETGGDVDQTYVINNLVRDMLQDCFIVNSQNNPSNGSFTGTKVINNTFIGNDRNVSVVRVDDFTQSQLTGFQFQNNIVTRTAAVTTTDMMLDLTAFGMAATYPMDSNIVWNHGSGIDSSNWDSPINSDPVLDSVYWPSFSGPARNAGNNNATISLLVPHDFNELTRPRNGGRDIGYVEVD